MGTTSGLLHSSALTAGQKMALLIIISNSKKQKKTAYPPVQPHHGTAHGFPLVTLADAHCPYPQLHICGTAKLRHRTTHGSQQPLLSPTHPTAAGAEDITAQQWCVWRHLIQESQGTAAVVTHSRLSIPENEVSGGSYLPNFSLKVIRVRKFTACSCSREVI